MPVKLEIIISLNMYIPENDILAADRKWLQDQLLQASDREEPLTQAEFEALNGLSVEYFASADTENRLLAAAPKSSGVTGQNVAVITMKGGMQKYRSRWSFFADYTVSTLEVAELIRMMDADPTVNSIVLNIDSGGGYVDGTYRLTETARACSKPVVAYVSGMAASAAYWVASAADEIYVDGPTDQVGSIGVLLTHTDLSERLDAMGVKITFLVSQGSEQKVIAPYTEPLSEADRDLLMQDLNETRSIFLKTIRKGRGNKMPNSSDNSPAFTGNTFNAATAEQLGLIDGQKSFDQTVRRANLLGRKQAAEAKSKAEVEAPKKVSRSTTNSKSFRNSMTLQSMFPTIFKPSADAKVIGEQTLSPEESAQLQSALVEFEKKAGESEAQQEALRNQVSDLQGQLKASQDKLTEVEGQLQATAQGALDAEELKTQLDAKTTALDELQSKYDALKADNDKLVGSLKEAGVDPAKVGQEPGNDDKKKTGAYIYESPTLNSLFKSRKNTYLSTEGVNWQ